MAATFTYQKQENAGQHRELHYDYDANGSLSGTLVVGMGAVDSTSFTNATAHEHPVATFATGTQTLTVTFLTKDDQGRMIVRGI